MSSTSQSRSTITGQRFSYSAGERTGWHRHDEHQLAVAASGALTLLTERTRWTLPPQRVMWIAAGVEHELVAETDAQMLALYLEPTHVDMVCGLRSAMVAAVRPMLRALVEELTQPQTRRPPDATARLEAVVHDEVIALQPEELSVPRVHDSRLRALEALLTSSPQDRRSLAELARSIGSSERTLARLIGAETGTTFRRWRTQLRLQTSLGHLASGASVTQTAIRSGFATPSSYVATFRATFGTTPRSFVERTLSTH